MLKIGFKTRYGLVSNPFAEGTTAGLGRILLIATDTTEELELTTSCNSDITHFLNKETLTGSFFVLVCMGTTQIQT